MPNLFIQVPPHAWAPLQTLAVAPISQVEQIVTYLEAAAPLADVEDLAEQCALATGTPLDLAQAIVTLVLNFSRLARDDESEKSLPDAFNEGIERAEIADWDEQKQRDWNERELLLRPLWQGGGTLETMSKARELLFDFQCVLRRSAVLSDVRPIYNREATGIDGALILHTLSLDYLEGDGWRQIHLTLSPTDVETLIEQLQRAQRKQRVSQQLLSAQDVPELTPRRNA